MKKNKNYTKKQKQQMILSRLGELNLDRAMCKSFQPSNNTSNNKKGELFRSNIEHVPNSALILGMNHQSQSHKEYLNESIKDLSSNDESVAEERVSQEEYTTVHQTVSNPHQLLNSGLEFYYQNKLEESLEKLEESKEEQQEEEKEDNSQDNIK